MSDKRHDRRWPLFSLTTSASSFFIEFSANCEDRKFRLRTSTGIYDFGGDQIWIHGAPLYVAIGYNALTDTLIVGASLGGSEVQTLVIINPFGPSALTFDTLRFRAAPDADNEVNEFRWIGGEANGDADPPTVESIKNAFSDLDFLGG